jgi:hypothetical protein
METIDTGGRDVGIIVPEIRLEARVSLGVEELE